MCKGHCPYVPPIPAFSQPYTMGMPDGNKRITGTHLVIRDIELDHSLG